MNMDVSDLMKRICNLEQWQQHQIVIGILSDINYDAENGDRKAIENLNTVIAEIKVLEEMNGREQT